jgi:superfamily II DNA or RNA helicase
VILPAEAIAQEWSQNVAARAEGWQFLPPCSPPGWQSMHPGFAPGDHLRVRGMTWILQGVTAHADCCELELEPACDDGPRTASPASRLVLLAPFDRPERLAAPGTVRVVSRRAWMAGLRRAILRDRRPGALVAPVDGVIDILPHQLEPAIAVVHHGATRLLLADEVGLGKTVEAAIVLAELRARGELDRALILAPPGLRDQWAAELGDRVAMEAAVADAGWLRTCRSALPVSVNPWSVPGVFVTSFDFAKRPEVRRSIEQVTWDAVVLDEAHLSAGDSDRRAAAHAIACRARVVLLLTATPHNGDARSFESLCRIGSLASDDPIVILRHDRAAAGLARRRRVLLHGVRATPGECTVRRALDEYIRRVWIRQVGRDGSDARLAMMVLLKRSFSGMAPLHRSLVARLGRLGAIAAPAARQLALEWDADTDAADEAPDEVLGAPGLGDAAEEGAVLAALVGLARAAGPGDSKRHALLRFLRRVREQAIVFTEYRDTLEPLREALGEDAGVLHGGLDRAERAAVLYRFTSGGLRVLLATDAAGEGLNLQRRCRLVVNLELPWNPARLEQRIGRVDRIGQPREVRAINFVASGTAEAGLLARLARRLDRACAAIGPMQDVLGHRDEDVVESQLGLGRAASEAAMASPAPIPGPGLVLQTDATALAANLEQLRRVARGARARERQPASRGRSRTRPGILVTAIRGHRLPGPLRRTGVLAVFRVHCPGPRRWADAHALVPVFLACPCPAILRARDACGRANAFLAESVSSLADAARLWAQFLPQPAAGFDRDAAIASRARHRPPSQRGLFDRRAEREAERVADRTTDRGDGRTEGPIFRRIGDAGGAPGASLELLLFVTS